MPNFNAAGLRTRRFKLTPAIIAREIRAARTAGERRSIVDTGCAGLRLIIGARTATWSVTARPRGIGPDGKRPPLKSVTLGDAAEISPEAARKAAAVVKRAIALGRDPVAERRAAQREQIRASHDATAKAKADSEMLEHILAPDRPIMPGKPAIYDFAVLAHANLGQCAAAFLLHGAGGGRLHGEQTASHLRRALAEMGAAELKPAELDKQRVRALAELHAKAGRPATARHRRGVVSRLFKWLQAVEAIEDNPAARVGAPPPPAPRSHVPSAAAVQALWEAAERLPAAKGVYVKLAILLPLRRQELANIKIANIVHDGGEIEIRLAAGQTKNKRPFVMPVVGTAAALVEDLLATVGETCDALIPLARRNRTFTSWPHFGRQIERETGDTFHWHDTRRLFASEMGEHRASDFFTIDSLLNHARSASMGSGVARSYHHAQERAPRRVAMAAWDRLVAHAVATGRWPRQEAKAEGNVVPLTARAASS